MEIKISLCSFSKMLPEEEKPLMTSCTSNYQTQNWKGGEECRAAVTVYNGSSWAALDWKSKEYHQVIFLHSLSDLLRNTRCFFARR